MQSRIQRFDGIFLKDFFAQQMPEAPLIIEEDLPPPPPPPSYNDTEMLAAKEAAHQQGYAEGMQDAKAQENAEQAARETATLEVLQAVATQLREMQGHFAAVLEAEQKETLKLALMMAKRLVHLHLTQHQEHYLQEFLDRNVEILLRKPSLTLHLHPELADAVSAALDPMLARMGFTGALNVRRDDTLEAFDVRLQWDYGHIEQTHTQAWAEMEALIAQFSLPATPSPAQE